MTTDMTRVLVAGGGVAGLEAALALQALAGDRVRIELLAPERHFTYRPLAVAEPFAAGAVQRFPLAAIGSERGVRVHRDALARVRPDERLVETQGAESLEYDSLILALGAWAVEAIPGALTFRGPQDAGRVGAIVDRLRDGSLRRVAFVVPADADVVPPAVRARAADRERGAYGAGCGAHRGDGRAAPVGGLGEAAADEVTALLERNGVMLITGAAVDEVSPDGHLRMGPSGRFGSITRSHCLDWWDRVRAASHATTSASCPWTSTCACPASTASSRSATSQPSP